MSRLSRRDIGGAPLSTAIGGQVFTERPEGRG